MLVTTSEEPGLNDALQLLRNPEILADILKELDKVIKDDYTTKLSVLFTGVSAYLREPLNLFIRGESGIGKSYNTTKVLELFPEKDVWTLGGLSPTALVHGYGVLMTEDGEEVDNIPKPEKPVRDDYDSKEEYREARKEYKEQQKAFAQRMRNCYNLVDLSKKILVFLESPNQKTFFILRPILSHDKWQISFKITDKTNKGSLQTKHVILQGWPATIFLNANDNYIEELATRSFTVSPTREKKKFKASNKLTTLRANEPWFETDRQPEISKIRMAFGLFSQLEILIPYMELEEFYPSDIPRDMRDYQHLIQFIKCITALHFSQRVTAKRNFVNYYLSNFSDVLLAWRMFSLIFETTRTGISQHLLNFYHEIIVSQERWKSEELTTEYNTAYKPKKSKKTIQKFLGILEDLGYVTCTTSEEDKRMNIYSPLLKENGTNTVKTEISDLTEADLEKSFEKWLNESGQKCEFYARKNVNSGDVEGKNETVKIDNNEVKNFLSHFSLFCPYLSDIFTTLESKNKLEKTDKQEKNQNVPILDKIKEIIELQNDSTQGECCICRYQKMLRYQVNFFDGTWGCLCEDCGYEVAKKTS